MGECRSKSAAGRGVAFLLTAVGALGLLGLGVFRGEFVETLRNAALICLSCIGIG